jgi:anti-sigma B factor antagonist
MQLTRPLEIEVENTRACMMVRVRGEAGAKCADDLERQLLPVTALKPKTLVIDLSDMTFISSIGLGTLLELQRGLALNGGVVRFAAPQPMVHETLCRCRLDRILNLFPTVESAVAG